MDELRAAFSEVANLFIEKANQEISLKNWKQYKGFTARRSRPGSACDHKKEVNEYIKFYQQEIDLILIRFKRAPLRKITEDFNEVGDPFEKPGATTSIKQPYSITKLLRQYSSSSSNSSSK